MNKETLEKKDRFAQLQKDCTKVLEEVNSFVIEQSKTL